MAATTTLLGLVTPTQGSLTGVWGDTVNYGITEYIDIAIAGTLSFAGDGAITLANTIGSSAGTAMTSTTAQYMVIRITGTQTVTKVITGPSYSKLYMVDHAGATSAVTFKAAGQTGVSVAVGEKCFVYYNGTDYVKVASSVADGVTTIDFGSTGLTPNTATSGAVTVAGTLAVANGGTGVTTSTGTTNVVLSNSPTLVTPALGTPSALIGTNITGTAIAFTASNVTTNANLTGGVTSVGNAATVVTNANLTGDITSVGNATTLTNAPVIAKVLTGYVSGAGTVAATDSILQAIQKLNGNDATNANLTGAITSVGNATSLGSFTSLQLLTALTDETGTGAAVFATSPTLVTPALGAATATSLVSSGTAASSFTVTSGSAVPLTITNVGTGNSFVVEDSASTDSSPFVIDANGYVVSGATQAYSAGTIVGVMQSHGTSVSIGAPSAYLWTADANGPIATMSKSRGATVGTHTVVQSGDVLGQTRYFGSDGTQFIQAAQIRADIDGTPGTNDMPGRLVFSTTADGASTPTERMRIDSAGRVGIGQVAPSSVPGATLYLNKSLTGGVVGVGATVSTSVLSDVTAVGRGFSTDIGVQDAVFTLSSLQHYFATQGTKGASATLTDQSGFYVNTTLTGATNNYGVYSSIAAAANRFNFYANGTAANLFAGVSQFAAGTAALPGITQISDLNTGIYFPAADTLGFTTAGTERMRIDSAGNVGIGGTSDVAVSFFNTKTITGGAFSYGYALSATIASTVGTHGIAYSSALGTPATAFTLPNLSSFYASQGTIGAGSTVTNQYGFNATNSLTGATNNYGFYSNIASGTNRYNFYAAGTADNYFAGSVGIGSTVLSTSGVKANIGGTYPAAGGASQVLYFGGNVDAAVTTSFAYLGSTFPTVGAGTLTTLAHLNIAQSTFTGTVTSQFGAAIAASLTGATNNYGFYSNIAAAANRWNFYANGTARNYMAADLTVNGATAIPAGGTAGAGLMVSTTANFGVFFGSGAPTLSAAKGSLYLRSDGSTVNDRMYVNTNGSTTWTNVVTSA